MVDLPGDGVLGIVRTPGTSHRGSWNDVSNDRRYLRESLPILSDTGAQADVTLSLQVRPETGVIQPGALVQYEEGAETFLGLVRGVSVDWQRPVLRQSITLETHLEA